MPDTVVEYYGSFIGGKERKDEGRTILDVHNPYNQEIIGRISCSTERDVQDAVENAHQVFENEMKKMPAHARADILRKSADLLEEKVEEFARSITLEAGKPIKDSRIEVMRAVQVLRFAADGARSLYGEYIPIDSAIGGENQLGFAKRIPLGVVAAITPFNFPLNLVLHKVAPAIAAGNSVVLKPAEKTPLTAVKLYYLLQEAGLPTGALNILMGPGEDVVPPLVQHPKVKKVSFTGSSRVGWMIKELVPRKKVTLELGSNAPNLVFNDGNLDLAVDLIVMGGYVYAGQTCVSAQRIYVEEDVYDAFIEKLVAKVKGLKIGDPLDEKTELGPMITEEAAIRAENWIKEAVELGATLVTGGKREGTFLEPTVLVDVKNEMKVVCAEVFAPVVSVIKFRSEEEVIQRANDSEFGLQAGIFTNDLNRAFRVADALEMGGVWINDVSVRRYDHMPYGGVKESGIGKEGIRYAIEQMTDIKFIGIRLQN